MDDSLTRSEIEALAHVAKYGARHSYTSCPPVTRAMCSYADAHQTALAKITRKETMSLDHAFDYVVRHTDEFRGIPMYYSAAHHLRPGAVVGDGRPSYIVMTDPVIEDKWVSVVIQYYPDGGRSVRQFNHTEEAHIPIMGVIPNTPADGAP